MPPPRGSEEYYQSRGSRRTSPSLRGDGDRILDIYTQQAEEQRAALDRGSRARADQIFNRYKMIGDAVDKGVTGYQEGKRFAREGEEHARRGEAHKKQLELSEEQIQGAKQARQVQGMESNLLYGPGWEAAQAEPANLVGPRRDYMGAPSRRVKQLDLADKQAEEQLAAAVASRQLAQKQTAMLGQKTPAERAAEARAEVEAALYTAQSLPPGPERQKLEDYARSKMADAGMSGAAFDVRSMEAASKFKTGQEQAATARNLAATTAPGYAEITPQLAEQEAKGTQLLGRAQALQEFENAKVWDPEAENVAMTKLAAGRTPAEQERLAQSSLNPLAGTKTERARAMLVNEAQDLKQQLVSLKARSATHPTLANRIASLEQQLRQVEGLIQVQNAGAPKPAQGPWTQYAGGGSQLYQATYPPGK